MSSIIIAIVLLGSIAGLAAVLVLSQRQYDPDDQAARRRPIEGPPPLPPARYASAGLASAVAAAIQSSTRTGPRNLAEVEALATMRAALNQAIEGEFKADVAAALDAIDGGLALHDLRAVEPAGDDPTTLDHVVVGRRGVTVIASRAGSGGLSIRGDGLFVGEGDDRTGDPMIGDTVRRMEAVADVVAPVPVHGLIVLRDVPSLPEQVRSGFVEIQGIRVATPGQLPEILDEPGPLSDWAVVVARLRAGFAPALPPVDDGIGPIGRHDSVGSR